MLDYNKNGWSALHEACYKGFTTSVARIINFAKSSSSMHDLLEMPTVDDFRATPLLIAALGGQLDIVKYLVDLGADLNATLHFNESTRHGVVEVAAIRNDMPLLVYVHDKMPEELARRLMALMASEVLDEQSRAALGRTVESLADHYPSVTAKLAAGRALSVDEQLAHLTFGDALALGKSLAAYLRLSEENEEALISGVITLLSVANDALVRRSFVDAKGVEFLVRCVEKHRKKLQADIVQLIAARQLQLEQPSSSSSNDEAAAAAPLIANETYIQCCSIGHALGSLSKHADFVAYINNEPGAFNEKIFAYVRTLFELNNVESFGETMPEPGRIRLHQHHYHHHHHNAQPG